MEYGNKGTDTLDTTINVTPRLFLDMDGVLADFDKAANQVLGMDNYKFEHIYGSEVYWNRLHRCGRFFEDLEPMPDALTLWYATRHLNPAILTALPRTNPDHVRAQKLSWVREWLGSDVEVITCRTPEKPEYCLPGDILVDDRAVNQQAWDDKGGYFVLHKSVGRTIASLAALGML